MHYKSLIIIVSFLFTFAFLLKGQNSRSTLESKRKELNKQIENTSKLLSQTSKSKQHTLQELSTLQKQMESRGDLIKVIRQELDSIEALLETKQEDVLRLTADLNKMKSAYKKVLVQLYRHKTNNNMVYFLFSSENFNKAFEKQMYLSQLEKRRSQQASIIRKTQISAKTEIGILESQRKEKALLLGEELDQSGSLNQELTEKDKMMRSLKSKESQLRKELAAKEDSKKQLNNKIEGIIRDQIAASKSDSRQYNNSTAKSGVKKSNDPSPSKSGKYIPSEPDRGDESSFAGRKGRLSPPVSGAVVVSKFGKQQHPLFEQVFTHNNGIDMRTPANANVRAVHKGTVVSVFTVPGNGNAVMIKHGAYYTTYSNLSNVYVKRGDELATGASLGTVGKDITTGNYLLHFELWNGKNKENPESWLK
jgi:septal ring factor EnvC (AmiA/AmiB activator)